MDPSTHSCNVWRRAVYRPCWPSQIPPHHHQFISKVAMHEEVSTHILSPSDQGHHIPLMLLRGYMNWESWLHYKLSNMDTKATKTSLLNQNLHHCTQLPPESVIYKSTHFPQSLLIWLYLLLYTKIK